MPKKHRCTKAGYAWLTIGLAFFAFIPSHAQDLSVDSTVLLATDGAPLWLHANRWGAVGTEGGQATLGAEVLYDRDFGSGFSLDLGVSVAVRGSEESTGVLRSAYGALGWRDVELRVGMFPHIVGILPDPATSSGSMSVSGNALPVPRIRFHTPDFVSIPRTNDALQFMTGIAHGQITGDRFIRDPLLHEKWFYGRVQRNEIFGVYLGLVHQVVWAGNPTDDSIEVDSVSWDSFRRVFLSQRSDDGKDWPDHINRAGDTLGIWDFGIEISFDRMDAHFYHHHFFEDSTGFSSVRNFRDGLWGLSFRIVQPLLGILDQITLEYLDTTDQSGNHHDLLTPSGRTVIIGGRDSYYSHSLYKSGWTHQGRIVGHPFFLTSGYDEDLRIGSNRIRAIHFGLSGSISEKTGWRALYASAQHRGAFGGQSIVTETEEGKRTIINHHLYELTHDVLFGREDLTGVVSLGIDHGFPWTEDTDPQIGDEFFETTIGVMMSVIWRY